MYSFFKIIVPGVLIAVTISIYTGEEYLDCPDSFSEITVETINTQNTIISDSEVESLGLKNEVLNLVNNYQSADELITTIYKKDELKTFISLKDILQKQPPECVRLSNNNLYFVYKYEGNNYLFLMYDNDDENLFPVSSWYVGKKTYCKDFENLAEKKASFNEVREFDPDGDYTSYYVSLATPLYTMHQTVDGYLIRLDYSCGIGEPLIIDKITKFSDEDNPIFYNLLSIDKELISD